MRRIAIALSGAVLLGAALAGCTSGGGTGGGTGSTPTTAPTTTAPEPTTPPTTTGPTTTVPAGGQGGSGTPRCHTTDLTVSDSADRGGGAAGRHGEYLVFTNRSGHTCTLYGYPGVSFVAGAKGTQVNLPFTRIDGTRSTIRLSPGGHAYALIVLVTYQNYPVADCKPVAIRGYRVYPPDETAAVFVSAPQKVCSVQNRGVGQVQPITSHRDD
jgi:hypothetical protein